MGRRIDSETKKTILHLHENGETVAEICRAVGFSWGPVKGVINKATGKVKSYESEQESESEELTDEEKAEFWKQKYLEAHSELLLNGLA